MKTIELGDEFTRLYEGNLLGEKVSVARVWPMPGAVILSVSFPDDELTPDQADDLARLLTKAAQDARHLHHPEDVNAEQLLDDRSVVTRRFRFPFATR